MEGAVLYPVQAYSIAATIRPRDAAACFDTTAIQVKMTKTQLIVQYADQGWAVAYDFGALVFVNITADERERVLKQLLERVGPEPHPPLVDDFVIEVRPGTQTPEVSFDRVMVGELRQPTIELIALIVAQSVAMEYYEEDVDQLLARLDKVSSRLAEVGGFHGSSRELIRFIGQGMSTRNQVLYTLSLLDEPPITWESEAYDRLYRALRAAFEIEERYRALDHKLRMIQENLELLVDLTRHRRTMLLEGTVIALIAIEVVLFVLQMTHHGFGG
ncbi:MAG TPA: RMD1 family protein [Polyangia bacterium]|nr:RMD1 family protein [Polyangia bacterium]